jgi:hypothetical protein
MAGEGHERCSKQRQEAGGSSSSQGPSTHPKNLAKRPRPSSLWEESSPEDYPPRGGTPDTPEEFECLKIRASDCHINRQEVDYNKEDPRNINTDDITNATRVRGPIAVVAHQVGCNPNQESQSGTCLLRL